MWIHKHLHTTNLIEWRWRCRTRRVIGDRQGQVMLACDSLSTVVANSHQDGLRFTDSGTNRSSPSRDLSKAGRTLARVYEPKDPIPRSFCRQVDPSTIKQRQGDFREAHASESSHAGVCASSRCAAAVGSTFPM